MFRKVVFVFALAVVIPYIAEWYYSISAVEIDEDYDFVIVGAGNTGSVVASRLSENRNIKVLLLEAGDSDALDLRINIPILQALTLRSSVDWKYETVPQTHACQSFEEQKSKWPKGKTLGGSTSINGMLYVRGHPEDFDRWQENGASGWSWENVLPYYKKSESATDKNLTEDFHGKSGPLKTTYSYSTPISSVFIEAGKELGYKEIDYNRGKEMEGFGRSQYTIKSGRRLNSVSAFIRPVIEERKLRLHVLTRAHVRQIVFKDNRAVGVRFVRDGIESFVGAKKEVILSAGAIGTPHLLMLSGVGPKGHLKEHGIEVIADLPGVGSNLQDHVFSPYFMRASKLPHNSVITQFTPILSLWEYLTKGTGPMGTSGMDALAFFKSKFAEDERVDFQFELQSFHWPVWPGMNMVQQQLGINQKFIDRVYSWAEKTGNSIFVDFMIIVGLLRPRSVGNIRLNSSDYTQHPVIDPKYLTDQRDVKVLIEGFRKAEELEQTEHFKDIGASSFLQFTDCGEPPPLPRPDSFYECFIRSLTITLSHQAGTAKMGPSDDVMSVVDPRLRIYKVKALRVADASVMPEVTSANTQAACYMIGEKASDMIKEDWKL